jgi:hypothetical protein
VSKRLWDLIERVGLTFVGAFIAVYLTAIVAAGSTFDVFKDPDLLDKAITAGVAAMFPLVAGLIGFKIGDKDSASIVVIKEKPEEPKDLDVPQGNPAPPITPEVEEG